MPSKRLLLLLRLLEVHLGLSGRCHWTLRRYKGLLLWLPLLLLLALLHSVVASALLRWTRGSLLLLLRCRLELTGCLRVVGAWLLTSGSVCTCLCTRVVKCLRLLLLLRKALLLRLLQDWAGLGSVDGLRGRLRLLNGSGLLRVLSVVLLLLLRLSLLWLHLHSGLSVLGLHRASVGGRGRRSGTTLSSGSRLLSVVLCEGA